MFIFSTNFAETTLPNLNLNLTKDMITPMREFFHLVKLYDCLLVYFLCTCCIRCVYCWGCYRSACYIRPFRIAHLFSLPALEEKEGKSESRTRGKG